MKKLALVLLALFACGLAQAQVPTTWPAPQGPQVIPQNASTTGTTGAITATLTGATGKFTYICGFIVTSVATSPANTGTVTITGTSPTLSFAYAFVNSGQGLLGAALGPGCVVSSATNTNIVVNVPASGGSGTVVAVSVWGYTN